MKKIFLTLFSLSILLFPVLSLQAANLNDAANKLNATAGKTGLTGGTAESLNTIIAKVIKGILSLVGTVFLVLTIFAGIKWMTASGEEEKITKAKDTIKSSIIGLAIVLGAYAITSFVTSKLMG